MELKLTNSVIGQSDISRLIRELNALDDFFTAANTRQGGTPLAPPNLSRMLDGLSQENQCNLLEPAQRRALSDKLKQALKIAPSLQISFASEPQTKFLEPILLWLRTNIHPLTLLQVGLQPTIAGGCVLRTPNRVIDMSLRYGLKKQEPYLAQLIDGAVRGN